MNAPQSTLKLARSFSDQNVYLTYVCLLNQITPSNFSNSQPGPGYVDEDIGEVDQEVAPIQVERSKAVHKLVEAKNKDKHAEESESEEDDKNQTTCDECERSDIDDFNEFSGNPNMLKLTKMKWLTEDQCDSPDSRSPSLSPNMSSTSICSKESYENPTDLNDPTDKYLSTILRLDREYNMFGLSNIAIVGSQLSRKPRKDYDRPVFPQTAIVQVCCARGCCRNVSKTDLPASLKCGSCRSCCLTSICYGTCLNPCSPCPPRSCKPKCTSPGECSCKSCASPPKCITECSRCFGMKVAVHRKPKYKPTPMELTPRSSCVMQKPAAAISCHHIPRCVPPSSVFPYMMPCFWPARPSAPCSVPARCFHNPPCLPPKKRIPPNMPSATCPPKCDTAESKCPNPSCLGKQFKKLNLVFVDRNKDKKKRCPKRRVECECSLPGCESCFVARPQILEYLPYLTTPTVTQNNSST